MTCKYCTNQMLLNTTGKTKLGDIQVYECVTCTAILIVHDYNAPDSWFLVKGVA